MVGEPFICRGTVSRGSTIINKENNFMKDFKKIAGASLAFAALYTFCMHNNSASITFPILMAAGIIFLYVLQEERKPFDNFISGFYVVGIMLVAVSVFMTGDWKLILMSKAVVVTLFMGLAIELYVDDSLWTDMIYVKKMLKLPFSSFFKGFEIFSDYGTFKENREEEANDSQFKNNVGKVLKGILIVVPVLFVILPLMMSADVVFENIIENILVNDLFEILFDEWNIVEVGLKFFFAFVVIFGFMKIITGKIDNVNFTQCSSDHITGITVTGVVAFIYVMFSFIQIRGIIFSNINLPEGYTYAEYAREGFFQLFALAIINMLIVLICASKYKYNKVLNTILYILCACTYVMIGSSSYKMVLYIEVYNLTFLRLMVLWSLMVLAFIMIAVIKYVYKNDFSLFKYMVIITTFFYMIVAFGRPDFIIAKYNLELGNEEQMDKYYLRELSCDAVPVLCEYPELFKDSYFNAMYEECQEDSIRKFNLSKVMASHKLEEYGE